VDQDIKVLVRQSH